MKNILKIKENNYGEMILHSIDKDGTGNGYDLEILINSITFLINQFY